MAGLERMIRNGLVAVGASATLFAAGCRSFFDEYFSHQCPDGRNVVVPDINRNGIADLAEQEYACNPGAGNRQPVPQPPAPTGGNGSENGNSPCPNVNVYCNGQGANEREQPTPNCCRRTSYCQGNNGAASAEVYNFFNIETPISPGAEVRRDSRHPRYRSRFSLGGGQAGPKQ